ncbi:hypothetical protein J3459_006360 [Metarhizium acridum]|nr:hypothetical protein J3459_006360 [Metarhizium acridum]
MFPALLGHPHAYEPYEDTPGDTGDFDETPPPSSRPSLSLASGEERQLCIIDIKAATTTHSRVPGPAEKSSQSVTSRALQATHQKSCAVRNTIATLVPTRVSQLGTKNQRVTVQDKVKDPLRRTCGPVDDKVHWTEEPEPLTSSSLLRIKHHRPSQVLKPTSSPSMANSAPDFEAIAAGDGVIQSPEIVSHSPHESRLMAEHPGHSFVSKVRPAEENCPTHQSVAHGDS